MYACSTWSILVGVSCCLLFLPAAHCMFALVSAEMFAILTELAKPTMLSYGNESEYHFPTPCPYPSALATRRLLQARKADRVMKG